MTTVKTGSPVAMRYVLACVLSLVCAAAVANDNALPAAGTVILVAGQTQATAADNSTRDLARRSAVYAGEQLSTGKNGRLQLRMSDGALISLGPNAVFLIKAYSQAATGAKQDAAVLSLVHGGLRTITGSIDKSAYRLETPVSTLGIRGTVFDVYVLDDGTTTVVLRDGAVDITGEGVVQQLVDKGLAVVIERNQAPGKPGPVPSAVVEYLKTFIPDLSANVVWHSNGDGSTVLNVGDDMVRVINMPSLTDTGDGSVPGEQNAIGELSAPAVGVAEEECCSFSSAGVSSSMAPEDMGLVAQMPSVASGLVAQLISASPSEAAIITAAPDMPTPDMPNQTSDMPDPAGPPP